MVVDRHGVISVGEACVSVGRAYNGLDWTGEGVTHLCHLFARCVDGYELLYLRACNLNDLDILCSRP